MIAKDINIYLDAQSWLDESPDVVLKGTVNYRGEGYIEIQDEKGYTQILNLTRLFAVVY